MKRISEKQRNTWLTVAARICLIASAIVLGLSLGHRGNGAGSSNPVTCELLSPVAGSVVSNTITLSANAFSLAAPITRVEYYCDGKLIATVTNSNLRPPSPKNMNVQ